MASCSAPGSFHCLAASNLLLLITSEKPGDEICLCALKTNKSITKKEHKFCTGLLGEVHTGCVTQTGNSNTAQALGFSQKAEMVKKQLLKKRVVLFSLKCIEIFLVKKNFFKYGNSILKKNYFFNF